MVQKRRVMGVTAGMYTPLSRVAMLVSSSCDIRGLISPTNEAYLKYMTLSIGWPGRRNAQILEIGTRTFSATVR